MIKIIIYITFRIMKTIISLFQLTFILLLVSGCGNDTKNQQAGQAQKAELTFKSRLISDTALYWWAHCPADVTGDGLDDLVFINQNSSGGYLAYLEGHVGGELWEEVVIAETPPSGGLFASGDMECGDMDGDGDMDVLGIKHPGEWQDADAEAEIYWYDNPEWNPLLVGTVPDAVKDVSLADFNEDGLLDMAVLTYDEASLSVFLQETGEAWDRVFYVEQFGNLHEGMGVGDFDGDKDIDIVATGHIFYHPGVDLTGNWESENLDEKWNNQTGDWSRNGTKTFVRDIDRDGRAEIFIAHSERAGYPLSMYSRSGDGSWTEQVILDSIPACHTLQVFDFDLDGAYDILAGINRGRAVNLGFESYELMVLLSRDNFTSFERKILTTKGIYNGQAADYDGDGDVDIFRYPHHEAAEFYLLENKIID
jgi:hypothetical protein